MESFFAPIKLNLFLHVTGRRADGYHLLESVFQLADFGDTVRLAVRADGVIRRTHVIEGVPEVTDLAVRAARLLQTESGSDLGADIAVDKRILMGGGLGGGSSDAATVLLALNRLWDLRWTRERLMSLGLKLGADVPFFIFGRNAFATGIGERLEAVDLPPRFYVVLRPQANVPTSAIFGSPDLTRNAKSVKIADFSADAWAFAKPMFRNDLEPVAKAQFPAVRAAQAWLAQHDSAASLSARMSGSGACVFAGFTSQGQAEAVLGQWLSGVDGDSAGGAAGFLAPSLALHPLAAYA